MVTVDEKGNVWKKAGKKPAELFLLAHAHEPRVARYAVMTLMGGRASSRLPCVKTETLGSAVQLI